MTSEMKGLTEKQMRDFMTIKGAKGLKKQYDIYHSKGGEVLGSGNFFEDVYKGIKDTGTKVNDFLKKTKIISKAGKFAKYVLPALAGVVGPEVLGAIPIAEKIGSTAETMGYGSQTQVLHPSYLKHYGEGVCGGRYSDMRGNGYTPGLTTVGMGNMGGEKPSVLTVAQNGTFQMTNPTHITNPGANTVANSRVDAGAPKLSGIQSGLGRMRGCGVGAFGVVAPISGIKI